MGTKNLHEHGLGSNKFEPYRPRYFNAGQMIDRTVPPSTRNALPFVAEARGLQTYTNQVRDFFGRCESLEQIVRTHLLEEKLLDFLFSLLVFRYELFNETGDTF